MRTVSFRVNTQHARHIRALDEAAIKHMLSDVVEFVREYSAVNTDALVSLLADYAVCHFGEPPDT